MRYPLQNLGPLLLTTLFPLAPYSFALPSPGTNPRVNDPRLPTSPTASNNDTTTTTLHIQGTSIPLLPDPCGPPTNQDSSAKPASKSTCNSKVDLSLEEQNPFHLNCTQDSTGYTIDWGSCAAIVNVACVLLEYVGRQGQVGAGRERWVWGVAPVGAFNCSLGFWVPNNSSLLPTYDRCKADIFGQMIEGCQGDATVNVASANLKRLPRRTETERDTGEPFDPLYPSYIIVAQNSVANAIT